jgi:hypothetical protein
MLTSVVLSFFQIASAADLNSAILFDRQQGDVREVGTVKPAEEYDYRIVYSFSDLKMKKGETVYLQLPKRAMGQLLDFAIVTHKQDNGDERECRYYNPQNDCYPAYTSVEFLDAHSSVNGDMWRYWGGVGSGPLNSKFAEIRRAEGESDNLYEWARHGHLGVDSKKKIYRSLAIAGVRVRSMGPDSMVLQRVIVKLAPPMTTDFDEGIFSRGLEFGDYLTAQGRRYPGHPSAGDYGTPLTLDGRGKSHSTPNIPKAWNYKNGALEIPLDKNKKFQSLDIACGDGKRIPYGANPENYRGNGKVTVKYVRPDGSSEILMDRENVGTNGVMRATLSSLKKPARGGYLSVYSNQGTVRVMGVRVAYEAP